MPLQPGERSKRRPRSSSAPPPAANDACPSSRPAPGLSTVNEAISPAPPASRACPAICRAGGWSACAGGQTICAAPSATGRSAPASAASPAQPSNSMRAGPSTMRMRVRTRPAPSPSPVAILTERRAASPSMRQGPPAEGADACSATGTRPCRPRPRRRPHDAARHRERGDAVRRDARLQLRRRDEGPVASQRDDQLGFVQQKPADGEPPAQEARDFGLGDETPRRQPRRAGVRLADAHPADLQPGSGQEPQRDRARGDDLDARNRLQAAFDQRAVLAPVDGGRQRQRRQKRREQEAGEDGEGFAHRRSVAVRRPRFKGARV